MGVEALETLENMAPVLLFASGISLIVLILIQLLKKTAPSFDGGSNSRFLPIISIVVGLVVGAIGYPFTDLPFILRLWAGFFAGAGASGLYDAKWLFTKKPDKTS